MDMAFHTPIGLPDGAVFRDSTYDSSSETSQTLRLLGWAELCAQLVASQDFRAARAAKYTQAASQASFHGSAAQWLTMLQKTGLDRTNVPADHSHNACGQVDENEVDINPTPSVAGQSVSGICLPGARGAKFAASANRNQSEMSA
jgi:hypothetical protein